jgi:hypothetical protein
MHIWVAGLCLSMRASARPLSHPHTHTTHRVTHAHLRVLAQGGDAGVGAFGREWRLVIYCRAVFEAAPAAKEFLSSSAPSSVSVKGTLMRGVPAHEVLYVAGQGMGTQSHVDALCTTLERKMCVHVSASATAWSRTVATSTSRSTRSIRSPTSVFARGVTAAVGLEGAREVR